MKYPKELAGLRGLAAAYVLIRHSLASLPPSFLGDLLNDKYGVKLFMIVSGFSIFWLLETKKQSYARFITGRFFRIFPVYILGLVIYACMQDFVRHTFEAAPMSPLNATRLELVSAAQSQFFAQFAVHLTLLQGLVPDSILPYSAYTFIGQAWSLTVEWQLYLIAPFVVYWISTIEQRRSQILLTLLVSILLLARGSLSPGFIGNNLAMFSVGMLSYAFAKQMKSRGETDSIQAYLVLLLILAAVWDIHNLPSVLVWAATFWAATAVRGGVVSGAISSFLLSRPIARLGRISYSFYIFHMASMFVCLRIIDVAGTPMALRYVLLPAASFALTTLIAELSYRYVECPFHRFGKAITDPSGTPATSRSTELEQITPTRA